MLVFIKKYKLTIITMLGILVVLLMPVPKIESEVSSEIINSIPFVDKIVHLAIFSFLGVVNMYESKRKSIKCFLVLCIFAITTEILQNQTGYRSFEILDILTDVIGVTLGGLACKKLMKN